MPPWQTGNSGKGVEIGLMRKKRGKRPSYKSWETLNQHLCMSLMPKQSYLRRAISKCYCTASTHPPTNAAFEYTEYTDWVWTTPPDFHNCCFILQEPSAAKKHLDVLYTPAPQARNLLDRLQVESHHKVKKELSIKTRTPVELSVWRIKPQWCQSCQHLQWERSKASAVLTAICPMAIHRHLEQCWQQHPK